jgi:2-methylcitrate dehydratase PrpD
VPTSTSIAQYSLAWPVAAALVRGRVTVDEVLPEAFGDADLRSMLARIGVRVDAEIDALYPERRAGKVAVTLKDGTRYESGLTEASGGPDPAPTRDEVIAKFRAFAGPVLGAERTAAIEAAVLGMTRDGARFAEVMALLVDAPKGAIRPR